MNRQEMKLQFIAAVAKESAKLSTCSSRDSVGAVLYTDDFRIIATGFNGSPPGIPHCDDVGCILDANGSCIIAVHAEMNAILQCAVYGTPTRGLNMFTTLSPCNRCAVAIVRAGIKRVTFEVEYSKQSFAENIFQTTGVRYKQWTR